VAEAGKVTLGAAPGWRRWPRAAWVGAYGVTTFLAFPHELAGFVLDLGWLFAWWPPALLLLAVRGLGAKRAAGLAFAAGTLAHGLVWHWIFVVTVRYGHAPPWVGVAAPLALALYPALFVAAFAAAGERLSSRSPLGPIALAALWTAFEHGRSFVLTGFPWATLGYAQHENGLLLGLAPWTGAYGLSFAAALGGLCALEWLQRREPGRSAKRALAGLALLLALHVAGALGREPAVPGARSLRIAVLQGNIDQGVKWSETWAERTILLYESLTREASARGARLVVWPETALPGAPDGDAALERRLAALARETGAALLVGAVGLSFGPTGELEGLFDSALLYDAAGTRLERYDKSHLVPFGEYLPLQRQLEAIGLEQLTRLRGGFDIGVVPRPLLRVPGLPTAAPLICYEAIFPREIVQGSERPALMLNLTNDGWFGNTTGPRQHLHQARVRAVEEGLPLMRAANNGVSVGVDGYGRILARLGLNVRGIIDVALPTALPPPLYARLGDTIFLMLWLIGTAVATVWR
jgi:apolipoprotein N-acyltransferase